jgi:hypothetical protein
MTLDSEQMRAQLCHHRRPYSQALQQRTGSNTHPPRNGQVRVAAHPDL